MGDRSQRGPLDPLFGPAPRVSLALTFSASDPTHAHSRPSRLVLPPLIMKKADIIQRDILVRPTYWLSRTSRRGQSSRATPVDDTASHQQGATYFSRSSTLHDLSRRLYEAFRANKQDGELLEPSLRRARASANCVRSAQYGLKVSRGKCVNQVERQLLYVLCTPSV